MNEIKLCREQGCVLCRRRPWQYTAAGLLALSLLWNVAQAARINDLEVVRMEVSAQLLQAERDCERVMADMEWIAVQKYDE